MFVNVNQFLIYIPSETRISLSYILIHITENNQRW